MAGLYNCVEVDKIKIDINHNSSPKKTTVDMSSAAVTARLELTEELRVLCLELGKAKPVAK